MSSGREQVEGLIRSTRLKRGKSASFHKWAAFHIDDLVALFQDQLQAAKAEALQKLTKEERDHENTISQRDDAEEWADKLAYAKFSVEQIGEHSNVNNPWANAYELLTAPKHKENK